MDVHDFLIFFCFSFLVQAILRAFEYPKSEGAENVVTGVLHDAAIHREKADGYFVLLCIPTCTYIPTEVGIDR